MVVVTKEWLIKRFQSKLGAWKALYHGHNVYIHDYANSTIDYLVDICKGRKKVSGFTADFYHHDLKVFKHDNIVKKVELVKLPALEVANLVLLFQEHKLMEYILDPD